MSSFSCSSIPKPKDWQSFERCCRVLFEDILGDQNTQLHGRSGQAQNGVDIWGRRSDGRLVGVQCKGKETYDHEFVSESELRGEVLKSRNFLPKISEFILVTTAPNDARIQEIARIITEENKKSGDDLIVNVWGWGDLESHIINYSKSLRAFHPDASPFTDELMAAQSELKSDTQAILEILQKNTMFSTASTTDNSIPSTEILESYIHGEIDNYRDMINNGQPSTAIYLLNKLKERCWETSSPRVKFRIINNIGAAKLALGDQKEAAEDFLEAARYDPTDKVAMANVALAHLLNNRLSEALIAAQKALLMDQKNEAAASYLIQSQIDDISIEDPLSLVSEELRSTLPVRIGTISFLRHQKKTSWRRYTKESLSLYPQEELMKRLSAEADLEESLEFKGYLLGEGDQSIGDLSKLEEVANVLSSMWDKIKNSEAVNIDTSLPGNLAITYRALGKSTLAATVLDEALKKQHSTDLIKLRLGTYLLLNETESALKFIDGIDSEDPDVTIMKAELLLEHSPSEVRTLLHTLLQFPANEDDFLNANNLVVQSYIRENEQVLASEQANLMINNYPNRAISQIALFQVQDHFNDKSANDTLTKAKNLINHSSSFFDRFIVADALASRGRHDEVVELLEGKVDFLRDTPALRLLFSAMINSDRRNQAHEGIRKLPDEISDRPFYLRVQIAVHINRGDYDSAEIAINKYMGLCPEELYMRLKWIDIRMRRGGEDDVRQFLEMTAVRLRGTPEEEMRLAQLLDHFGFPERALSLGYRVFITNRSNPQIHLQYMSLLLLSNRTEYKITECKEVGYDVVFNIQSISGEKDTYLIEPDTQLRVLEYAISPDHAIARKSFGLKIGDSFIINEKKEPADIWRIISLKHKWLDALHKTMERFERQFPTVDGIEKIIIDEKDADSLKPILARVKSRHDSINTILDQYVKDSLPLYMLAHSLGTDVIQVLCALVTAKKKFRICIGTTAERNTAIKAILDNNQKGCVIDALTFYIIRRLNIESTLLSVCGSIGMTESSIEIFRQRCEEIRSHIGKPSMTVFWNDGQLYRDEITDERIQQALSILEADLDWIYKNCSILPAEGTIDPPFYIREFSKEFKGVFFDPILAADGSKRLLVCEDFYYRNLGAVQQNLRSTWLQPILTIALQRNMINIHKYYKALLEMIDYNADFISIDSNVLLTAAYDKNDDEGLRFAKLAELLGGSSADLNSHIRVAVLFFHQIWQDDSPCLNYKSKTGKILERIIVERQEYADIINNIINSYSVLTKDKKFLNYLFGWLRGHFLIPFD